MDNKLHEMLKKASEIVKSNRKPFEPDVLVTPKGVLKRDKETGEYSWVEDTIVTNEGIFTRDPETDEYHHNPNCIGI